MFDWSIYSLFVLNKAWKRDSLQIMTFLYVCWTWGIVELKTRYETRITWNDVNGVSLFHISYLITLMACLRSQRTPNVQITYFMFDWPIYILFVLNKVWKRDSLQMLIFRNVCATWSLVQLNTCTRFETLMARNDVYGVSLIQLYYLITLMDYLCSQSTPNFQINSFILSWTIYRLFVLNRSWRSDSFQIMVVVYVCSICSVVELKKAVWNLIRKKWRKWCKFVSPFLFNNTYGLLWTPNVQIN
jgi:hypothetical protein